MVESEVDTVIIGCKSSMLAIDFITPVTVVSISIEAVKVLIVNPSTKVVIVCSDNFAVDDTAVGDEEQPHLCISVAKETIIHQIGICISSGTVNVFEQDLS